MVIWGLLRSGLYVRRGFTLGHAFGDDVARAAKGSSGFLFGLQCDQGIPFRWHGARNSCRWIVASGRRWPACVLLPRRFRLIPSAATNALNQVAGVGDEPALTAAIRLVTSSTEVVARGEPGLVPGWGGGADRIHGQD